MSIIHIICGARPNFIKAAPLYRILLKSIHFTPKLIHTGQHYDHSLSKVFLDEFGIKSPDYFLNVGSGSHTEQVANTMLAYESLLEKETLPKLVIVIGDVNATLSCALVAKRKNLPLAHLEAGLRNRDLSMPEEVNRRLVDHIADYHWTHSKEATQNLLNEGISKERIRCVGNILIDAYEALKPQISKREAWRQSGLEESSYILTTLHRPQSVDHVHHLSEILQSLESIELPIIWPIHPRSKKTLERINIHPKNLKLVEPLGYIDFMSLLSGAFCVITDSGGIQEETTYLNIPCFTLRDNTERPMTVSMGSNTLTNIKTLKNSLQFPKNSTIPPLWDGKTSGRILKYLEDLLT